ncbi:MAG: phosphotransferase [Solirubrobacterales bacterium]|nr:phosphotransferase [Solirubrobacterales bacterium]MBV9050388.1 phosphotransferase [Solirubrobacterales bacterium]
MRNDRGELILTGGYTNAGRVVRVGDTVRRPRHRTSASTHAVLEHLERVRFDGAPRFLGVDESGREVLSYIEGCAVTDPYPDWALTDGALISVARLMRRYHEAMQSFDPAAYRWPNALPERFRGDLVTHNDPNLDNVIFADGRAVALIDFDLASPGSTVWDVACAARLWAPLREECDVPGRIRRRVLARLRLFVDAYGLSDADREQLADAIPEAHEWCYRIVRGAVADGHETFQQVWREGARSRAERTRRWLTTHTGLIRAAVRDAGAGLVTVNRY